MPDLFRYAFLVEYDGTSFSGWQAQKGLLTIQGCLEKALEALTSHLGVCSAAGRTDAGVHALGQVFHVDFPRAWPLHTLRQGINFYLKSFPISVVDVRSVPLSFHARFSAIKRKYVYRILNRSSTSPLLKHRAWLVYKTLDLEKIQEGLNFLQGTHDFSRFRSSFCQAKSPIKTLDEAAMTTRGAHLWVSFFSRSFLHHQVRMMTGALIQLGTRQIPIEMFQSYLDQPQEPAKAFKAPAWGLYFREVEYADQIFDEQSTEGLIL